jgi:protein-tyrosine-phosphatase
MKTHTLYWRVLFVCTANTCRSRMAEALVQVPRSRFRSAGLWADSESVMYSEGVDACEKVCSDTGTSFDREKTVAQFSKQVTQALVKWAHVIVVMEKWQEVELRQRFSLRSNSRLLVLGIPDPIGTSEEAYEITAAHVKHEAERVLTPLCRRRRKKVHSQRR